MVEQGSPEWFAARAGKVTASRVADILAMTKSGPSASRQNLLIKLAIERVTGQIEKGFTSEAMEWGVENEAQARVAYEVASGNFVDQVGFIDHPTIANFGASPDGLVGDNGLVEIKCPNSATHWETIKSGKVPSKYLPQVQTQMACTGRDWVDFVSFDPRMPDRSKLFIKRVQRDTEFIFVILEPAVRQFLSEVDREVGKIRNYEP
jgi:putative phage-type endonuclease